MKLTVSDITKTYQGKTILKDCSCAFRSRGVYVLMGRNGSGKSTFLRICALLEDPDQGVIVFSDDNGPLLPDEALKKRITLVLPKIGVFNTTAFHNVEYGLKLRGMARDKRERKVREMLDFVGLGHKRNQDARTLSSGETQRLGIARALVIEPEILLLDEPTASLDEENVAVIEAIIRDLKKDGRTTVIMTTHDRDQAERIADVMLVMRNGRIEAAGEQ